MAYQGKWCSSWLNFIKPETKAVDLRSVSEIFAETPRSCDWIVFLQRHLKQRNRFAAVYLYLWEEHRKLLKMYKYGFGKKNSLMNELLEKDSLSCPGDVEIIMFSRAMSNADRNTNTLDW